MPSNPLALPPIQPSELLTHILAHQNYPTTLIVCKPRAAFLDSLVQCVASHQNIPSQAPQAAHAHIKTPNLQPDDHGTATTLSSDRHSLLIPTLYQVATSRYINLVFVPTVSHLRAYLAVFPEFASSGTSTGTLPSPSANLPPASLPKSHSMKLGGREPSLIVYGLVEMHRSTSEWSVQGLSRSLAGLVEAGRRAGRRVVALEERGLDSQAEDEEEAGGEEEVEGEFLDVDADWVRIEEERRSRREKARLRVWEEKVPMLNGSVRRAGFESEDGAWSGRTIAIGRIFQRWFRFGRAV